MITFNELLSNIFCLNIFSLLLTWLNNNINLHKRERSFLLLKRKYVMNLFSINKFMMLKYLFYIIIHKL